MEIPNKCRICYSGKNQQSLRTEFVYGGSDKYNFWQCKSCGLVYLYPIPSIEDEKRFYALEFEKFMEKRSGSDRNWTGPEAHIKSNQDTVKRRWKFLRDQLFDNASILEVGCSSGFMMDFLKEQGYHVTGIEPSGSFSGFLNSRGNKYYQSIKELKLKEPDKKFDFVLHFFVLEHVRDTKVFLQEQLDLLNPNGKIIAEVPNVNDPLTSLYKIPAFERFYWSIVHHYYFNPESLSQVLDCLDCDYKFLPEQRYDLSNHLVWMQEGKPGGQGKYNHIFSKETNENYLNDLKASGHCDTFILYITKPSEQ